MTSLVQQLAEKISAPRCRPWCDPADLLDGPAVKGMIRTVCGVCGTFIGYRPVAGAKARKASEETEAAE